MRDGFKRCTRAVVNAPPMAQVRLSLLSHIFFAFITKAARRAILIRCVLLTNETIFQVLLQSSSSSNMVATQLPRSTPIPELSFFVGPKRDDCKMSSSVTVPHNCDQLRQGSLPQNLLFKNELSWVYNHVKCNQIFCTRKRLGGFTPHPHPPPYTSPH